MIIIFFLLFMFLLGVVQVVWAVIQAIATRHETVRKHFGLYGLGVILYFVIWWAMFEQGGYREEDSLFVMHFLGGAGLLCAYHVWIVVVSVQLKRLAEPKADWI
jgi:hypothetical protein